MRHGVISEHLVDIALRRLWTKSFQLGVLDQAAPSNPNPYSRLGAEAVDTPSNRALALEAALQGLVLLHNQAATLPLNPARIRRLALIGPHANGSLIFLGGPNYHGDNHIVSEQTPLLRARAWLPNVEVDYELGCTVAGNDTSGVARAVSLAADADVVVLFLGLDQSIENEGVDRSSLELPGIQSRLALAVAEAAHVHVVHSMRQIE